MVKNSGNRPTKIFVALTAVILALPFNVAIAEDKIVSLICELETGVGPAYEFSIPIVDSGLTYGSVTLVGQDVTDDVRWVVGATSINGMGQGVCIFDYCDSVNREVDFKFDRRDLSMATKVYLSLPSSTLNFDAAAFIEEAEKTMESSEAYMALNDKMAELREMDRNRDSYGRENYQCSKVEAPDLAF